MDKYSEYSDHELATLLKSGDAMAYTEFFSRYNRLLFVHAFRLLGNEEEARDLVQDVFVTIWEKREELSIRDNPSGFFYTMIRYRVFDKIAHKKVEDKFLTSLRTFFDIGEANTDHILRTRELEAIIEKEIDNLPEYLKTTFTLSRKEQLSHKQIAELLNISEKTVRNQVSKALKILRVKLGIVLYFYMLFKL